MYKSHIDTVYIILYLGTINCRKKMLTSYSLASNRIKCVYTWKNHIKRENNASSGICSKFFSYLGIIKGWLYVAANSKWDISNKVNRQRNFVGWKYFSPVVWSIHSPTRIVVNKENCIQNFCALFILALFYAATTRWFWDFACRLALNIDFGKWTDKVILCVYVCVQFKIRWKKRHTQAISDLIKHNY